MIDDLTFALERMLHLPPPAVENLSLEVQNPQAFARAVASEAPPGARAVEPKPGEALHLLGMTVVEHSALLPGQFIMRGSRDGQPVIIIAGFYD